MMPLLEQIVEREAAAVAAADVLREQIAKLSTELTLIETELTELAITRKTLLKLTGELEASTPVDATIASTAYQQIFAVLTIATTPMRAKDICLALGTGITARDTESLCAKLKRLVARQILTEAEPGLFMLAPTPTA